MSLSYLLSILKARWLSAGLTFLIVLAASAAFTLSQPKRYTATASVLIDVKSPDPVAGMVLQGLSSPSYMLTQVDIIQSSRVAQRVAKALKMTEDPVLRGQWQKATKGQGDFEAWVADGLRATLDARPSRGSNVITVGITARDPAFAAAAANAFVQSYIDTTLELRVDPARQYSRFFDSHAKQLRANLEAAQAKLSAYQQSKGILATDEKLDLENARLTELSTQLVALQAVASESGSRSGQSRINGDQMPEVLNNAVISGLTSDLSRQEAKLDELNARLGDQHPQVKELQANVEQLKNRIRIETRKVNDSVRVNNNVNQNRLAELRDELEQQRAKVLQMKGRRDEAAVMQQDVENAQRAYDNVLGRLNQTSLEGQTAQANVSALELATAPSQPSSPQVRTTLVLGTVLAFVLAAMMAAIREMRDRRLRTSDEIAALINQPIIGMVPTFGKNRQALPFSPKRLALGHRSPGAS